MKKLIYSLAIAMAFGVSANAAAPVAQVKAQPISKASQLLSASELDFSNTFTRLTPDKRLDKKKVSSAADFVGIYAWSGTNQLQEVVFPNEGVLQITQDPSDPNKLEVSGFNPYNTFKANFDPAKGRLYIPQQFVFRNEYYNEDVYFWCGSVENATGADGQPGYYIVPKSGRDFYFTLTEDGNLKSGDIDMDRWNAHTYTNEELLDLCVMGVAGMLDNDSGYFWFIFNIHGTPVYTFDYIEDEWEYLGTASFKDAWFPIYWENENTPTYDLPVYYKKWDESKGEYGGTYMLYSPYGKGTPYSDPSLFEDGSTINYDPDTTGFLIFNISNPNCVVFQPLVYSITLDMRESATDPASPRETYCYNEEGALYYLQNATKEEIIENYFLNDKKASSFNSADYTVTILHPYFSFQSDITTPTFWQVNTAEGFIQLPANYTDGVEAILGEEVAAPAEYFNLQGLRVNNPEKGQLVIVRQGKKVSKMIVR